MFTHASTLGTHTNALSLSLYLFYFVSLYLSLSPHRPPSPPSTLPGRVVSNFIMQALAGEDITIYGDGSQTRSFCFCDDLIEAFMRMMSQDDEIGPVNTGNPTEFTIKELAEMTVRLCGSSSKISYLPLPRDDPKQRRPDITKARAVLDGWEPNIQLEEGLVKTIDYFRNLDMRRFKKPTKHTAHTNSEADAAKEEASAKRQKTA